MPDYELEDPTGKKFRVTVPDGTPQEEVLAFFHKQMPVPQSGIPESGASRAGADVHGMGSAALNFGKKAALPTAGSIALPAVMTMGLGPANAPFIPLEQGIGSGLGEVVNQALGITEPSLTQIGTSTLAPIAVGYGVNALRASGVLPKTLNTEGPNLAKGQLKGYRGAESAKDVMEQATQQGITIPMADTTTALQQMRNILVDKTPAAQRAFEKVMKDTGLEDLATAPSGITPSKMQGLLEDVGALQQAAEDPIERKYLGRLFGALNKDLDDAGAALGPARDYWKREQVLNDLDKAITNAVFTPKGQGLQTQFNANKIINELNDKSEGLGKWFSQSFTIAEQGEIKNLLGFLNTLPSLKPGAGQNWGSGRFWERGAHVGAGASIGGAAGFAVAGPAGAAVGAGAGALVPEVAEISKLVFQAWKMPGGRETVKRLFLNSDGASVPHMASALTAFINSGRAKNVTPVQSGSMMMPFGNEK
jgi:hypothetical protein